MRVALHRDSKGFFDRRLKSMSQFGAAPRPQRDRLSYDLASFFGTYRWIIKPGPDDIEFRPHQKSPQTGQLLVLDRVPIICPNPPRGIHMSAFYVGYPEFAVEPQGHLGKKFR